MLGLKTFILKGEGFFMNDGAGFQARGKLL
jgi:hypothetical protein